MYCVVPTGRQFGKTLLGINQAIKWGAEQKGWNIVWVSPTYKQCKKVFRQLLKGLNDCPYVKDINRSDLIIEFDTGSYITFYSAEAYHQVYYRRNPEQPYCQFVIAPKVAKFRENHWNRLKGEFSKT